jgi:hypothetical protein
LILSILNDVLATVWLSYALFFFAKETVVCYTHNHMLVCLATLFTVTPMWASSALRLLEVEVPGWLMLLEAPAGVAIRLSIVVLCYATAVWSPWEPRRTAQACA